MHTRGVEAVDVLATEGRGFEYQGDEFEGALRFLLAETKKEMIAQKEIIAPAASKQGVTA
jgi:hypothetical protein